MEPYVASGSTSFTHRCLTVFFWLVIAAVPAILLVGAVASPDTISVNGIEIADPSRTQTFWTAAGAAVYPGVVAIGLFHLRRLTGSIRRGDPFTSVNVRHLRWIAFLLILQPVFQAAASFIWSGVAGRGGLDISVRIEAVLAGLCIGVIAEVFEYGATMREEVEGTV